MARVVRKVTKLKKIKKPKVLPGEQIALDRMEAVVESIREEIEALQQAEELAVARFRGMWQLITERSGSPRKLPRAEWRKDLIEFVKDVGRPVSRKEMLAHLCEELDHEVTVNNLSSALVDLVSRGWFMSSEAGSGLYEHITQNEWTESHSTTDDDNEA